MYIIFFSSIFFDTMYINVTTHKTIFSSFIFQIISYILIIKLLLKWLIPLLICSLWYSVVITKNWKPKLEQHSVYILMEMIWQVINEMTRYFEFCKIPQFLGKINRRKKNKTFHGNEHFFITKQIINTNIVTFQTIINTFTYKFQIEF